MHAACFLCLRVSPTLNIRRQLMPVLGVRVDAGTTPLDKTASPSPPHRPSGAETTALEEKSTSRAPPTPEGKRTHVAAPRFASMCHIETFSKQLSESHVSLCDDGKCTSLHYFTLPDHTHTQHLALLIHAITHTHTHTHIHTHTHTHPRPRGLV
jgi:hypothetical protein